MKTLARFLWLAAGCCATACGNEFLEVKPDQSQRIPSTIADYQAMMDYSTNWMNTASSHELALVGGEEFSISDAQWNSFPIDLSGPVTYQKNAYTWAKEVFQGGETGNDWVVGYVRILRANVVLDGLAAMQPMSNELPEWEQVKGAALFHRALNYYSMAQLFCGVYDPASVSGQPGLPLRLSADLTTLIPRSTLQETYECILNDLRQAAELLPEKPIHQFRPSKAAVFALLTRVYLQMREYPLALESADRSLRISGELLDYNGVNTSARYPFPVYGEGNPEVLFMNNMPNTLISRVTYHNIFPSLLAAYEPDDLRLLAFFYRYSDGRITFKGSYRGSSQYFTGLATGEMYLARAECYARLGQPGKALDDMNHLLVHRYVSGAYTPLVTIAEDDLLPLILLERRKELLFRGVRWEDLRRLNHEGRFQTTLKRTIDGKTYELPPEHPNWTWPIPPEAIAIGGYQQNERN